MSCKIFNIFYWHNWFINHADGKQGMKRICKKCNKKQIWSIENNNWSDIIQIKS